MRRVVLRRWQGWSLLLVVSLAQVAPDHEVLVKVFESADGDKSGSLDEVEFEGAVATLERERFIEQEKAQASMAQQAVGFASVPKPRLRSQAQIAARGPAPVVVATSSSSSEEGGKEFSKAFVNTLGMIWATELGDKTFFIAAVLAMRHSRCLVFTGAFAALIVMTILSVALGYTLPSLLPRKYTHYASALLFLYFGIRLLRDARTMNATGPSDELVEVEDELADSRNLAKKDNPNSPSYAKRIDNDSNGDDSENGGFSKKNQSSQQKRPKGPKGALGILSQGFCLTFLAEWGDRSQIATIALAAAKDPLGVTLGGITGHAMCTGLAVVGGRMLASRISEQKIAIVGGILFLLFATYAMFFEDVPSDLPVAIQHTRS